jgi:hypothetical protein
MLAMSNFEVVAAHSFESANEKPLPGVSASIVTSCFYQILGINIISLLLKAGLPQAE